MVETPKVDPIIGEVPPVAPEASNMSKAGEAWANSRTKQGFDKIAASGKPLAEGVQAIGARFKDLFLGGAGKTKGAVGGIVGGTVNVADSVTGKAAGMVGGVASGAGRFAKAFPLLATIGAGAAIYMVVKSWFKKRDQKTELAELGKQNELAATQLANSGMQSRMPEFNNDVAAADFAKRYGARDQSLSR